MAWKRTWQSIATITTLLLSLAAFAAMHYGWVKPQAMAGVRTIDPTFFGRRVLVVVPHPDDEVLTSGGAIQRLLSEGARVRVVIVTAGDGYPSAALRLSGRLTPAAFLHLGEVRHGECLAADKALGLSPVDVTFLGFPDGGTTTMWNANWSAVTTRVGRTGLSAVPYTWALRPGAPYTGTALVSELAGIIRDFAPDTVISTDTRETHPDHSAVAAFTMFAMDETGFSGHRLTALVHYRGYPSLLAFLPNGALQPPPGLVSSDSQWLGLHVSPSHDRVTLAALNKYQSQALFFRRLAPYMSVLVRTNELFDERPPAPVQHTSSDARPSDGASGTVLVTPPPGDFRYVPTPGRIDSVRLISGPTVTWIGIVSHEPPAIDHQYGVSLRLVSAGATARVDVAVQQGRPVVQRICGDSIDPSGVTAQISGQTVWVGVPTSAFDGYARAILQTTSTGPGQFPFRTAWREVTL